MWLILFLIARTLHYCKKCRFQHCALETFCCYVSHSCSICSINVCINAVMLTCVLGLLTFLLGAVLVSYVAFLPYLLIHSPQYVFFVALHVHCVVCFGQKKKKNSCALHPSCIN